MRPVAGVATPRFFPGTSIAWRNCIRVDASRTLHPSYAIAMTVVRDAADELVLFRRPGHPMKRRNAEVTAAPSTFRHAQIVRWLEGWSDDPIWRRWQVLVFMRPDSHHAISLFTDDATGRPDFWYIDLIGPVRRRLFGFDFDEHGLDIVVRPDMSSWKWKDEDELEFAVQRGVYSQAEADELHAEGRRAVDRLIAGRADFERWLAWRPDPSWPIAMFPPDWDAL